MGRKQSKSGQSKKERIGRYGEKRRRGLQSKEKTTQKEEIEDTKHKLIVFL